jgi:transposase-like protein
VKGRWCYLYRAIDSKGATIDFLRSALHDADAAKRLFRQGLSDRSHPRRRGNARNSIRDPARLRDDMRENLDLDRRSDKWVVLLEQPDSRAFVPSFFRDELLVGHPPQVVSYRAHEN